MIIVILPVRTKKQLIEKLNQSSNTNYTIKDIIRIIEYKDNIRQIELIEIILKDYTSQRYIKSNLDIDNFM